MKTKRKLLLSLSILTALVNILIMSSGVYGSVIQINNSNDSGPGTLRQALLDAVSGDTIVFDITVFPPTSPAIIAITSGQLPAITQGNLTIDASNAGVVLDGSACENCMGFTVASDSNIIKGFQIQNFPLDGIRIGESNNPSFNTIGGERTKGTGPNGEGNTIVGCGASGIAIYGSNVSNNIVIGNYVGVDVTGVFSMPNGRGVNIRAPSNTIGSALPDERNVISGNRDAGVWIETSNGHHNVIIGNYIGTNAAGTDSLGNGTGVMISRFEGGPTSNTIGGSSANERNIISGNDYTGVLIEGSGSSVNIVRGNFIGTDVTGTKRLPNGPSGKGVFVFNGANDNIIGGSNPNEGNVISGNDYAGVEIHGAGTTGNQVQGNYIGTDVSGTIALVNREKGVFIFNGAQYNMVGGSDVGARNIISGNNGSGIILESTGTTNNIVKGNFIGTDISGTVPLPNRDDGVGISDGASNNTLGGEIEGERNIISGNSDNGIAISGSTTENNNVIGNYIGTDVSGKNALSNGVQGVSVTNGAKHNLIGGNKPGSGLWAGNLISGNNGSGIYIGPGTTENIVRGNLIKGNTGRGIEFTSSSAMITNNTIVDNNNGGLAAYSNSSVEIKNNIIVQNQGGGILTDESSTSKIAYNDVWKNRTDYSGCSAGTGDISANPFFVDPTRHNYHLQLGSPCIDAGNPDIAYNDIDATRNDMGAYGGPHGESYTYPDGLPFIDGSATFTSGFVEPGNPVTIYSLVYDLVGSVVSVVAEIESPDETLLTNLPLYDDGVHNDVAAGDNVWANSWTTEEMPRTYFVDIIAIDNNSNTAVIENVALFTTDRSTLPLQLTSSRGNDENPALCQTSDGDVWLFWNSNRDGYAQIWYKKRNDGGVTWSNDQRLSTRQDCHSPSVAQSSDGKIWLFWYETRGQDIWYVTSSDYGNTWSPLQQFTTNPSVDERPNVATDANGKMVVVWNSWRTGNHDVFCKVSLDNGNTWTNPIQITSHLAMDEDPSVVIDANGSIHVVWYWQHDYIKYSESSDNGGTWNEPIILTSGLGGISRHPAIDLDSSGKIWLTFNHWESRRNESRSDLFYTISTNSFEWTAPIQITQFAGYDGFSDIATINNQQWLVWHSERAVNFDIWAGKTDFIQDMNPPPTAYWVKHQPYSPAPTATDNITIQTEVSDESAITSIYLVYSINSSRQAKLVMYDDGNHNDGAVGDDIWAIAIGKYPAGTIIDYQVEVRDIAGNTIRSPEYPAQAEVLEPFVQKSNLLLVADYQDDYSDWLLPYYTNALENNGFTFDVWDSFLRGAIDQDTLNIYVNGIVIWFTPFGGSYLTDQSVQENIEKYLEAGGKLFITGQDIGSTIGDTDFYRDYLQAQFVQELEEAYIVNGIKEDPITGGLNLVIIEGDGADNQWRVDEINPLAPAVPIFVYGQTSGSLVKSRKYNRTYQKKLNKERFNFSEDVADQSFKDRTPNLGKAFSSTGTAAIRVDTSTHKLVYFAFGFEAINKTEDRDFLMFSVLKWLVPSIHEAGISYVTPDKGYNQDSVTVTIHGFGFAPEATVRLRKSGYQDIIGTETTVVDSNKIITTFDLAGYALGDWDVIVINPNNQIITLPEGFNITVGYIKLWGDIIGREQMRIGREFTYTILVGNSGNVDANNMILKISLPEGTEFLGLYTSTQTKSLINIDSLQAYNIKPVNIPVWISQLNPNEILEFRLRLLKPFSLRRGISINQNSPKISITATVLSTLHTFARSSLEALQDDDIISPEEWYQITVKTSNEFQVCALQTMLVYAATSLTSGPATPYVVAFFEAWAWTDLTVKIIEDKEEIIKYIEKQKSLQFVNSLDPNEKVGMAGFSRNNSLSYIETFRYIIYFENVDSATAAAQEITILDSLDENLDLSNFYFADIQLGDTIFKIPDYSQQYYQTIHLNDTTDMDIELTLDQNTGFIKWQLKGINLEYGGLGDILPPNKIPTEGEGWVSFSIKPKQNLASGTQIKNRASIVFDVNPAIITNEIVNTIDALAPNSNVSEVSPTTTTLEYNVQWTGEDDALGSGLKNYTIFLSNNGGPFRAWLMNTGETSAILTAEDAHVYRFYSIARDSVGNIETQPNSFDVKIVAKVSDFIPTRFYLSQNFPNPFNSVTTILYELPETSNVKLEIFNILGQKVRTLVNEKKEGGYYEEVWNGRNDLDLKVASGIYLFRLKTDKFVEVKKAVFLK